MTIIRRNKIRHELILLMRGFYSLPILLNLHKYGILKILHSNKYVNISKIKNKNKFFLEKTFDYLYRLNILDKKNNGYKLSKLGRTVLVRIGSFYILNSYSKINLNFSKNLQKASNLNNLCKREENIIGSGLIHKRKFFEPSLDLINLKKRNIIFDLGCGDGTFLNLAKKVNSKIKILGCDLSNKSVLKTKKNLKISNKDFIFKSDAFEIDSIKKKFDKKKIFLDKNSIVSMWFLLHEISNNSKNLLINYLIKVRNNFPDTPIIVGEISLLQEQKIKAHNKISIMPEIQLFHELSGQGLLTESDFFSIFKKSSYNVKKIIRTDKLNYNGIYSSSNFISLIEPKNNE